MCHSWLLIFNITLITMLEHLCIVQSARINSNDLHLLMFYIYPILTHSLTHSLTPSLTHSLTHSYSLLAIKLTSSENGMPGTRHQNIHQLTEVLILSTDTILEPSTIFPTAEERRIVMVLIFAAALAKLLCKSNQTAFGTRINASMYNCIDRYLLL